MPQTLTCSLAAAQDTVHHAMCRDLASPSEPAQGPHRPHIQRHLKAGCTE